MQPIRHFPRDFFLKLHPRTKLWREQRYTCAQCENFYRKDSAWKCKAVMGGGAHTPLFQDDTCISAREGQQCGPDAKLYQAKKEPPKGGS